MSSLTLDHLPTEEERLTKSVTMEGSTVDVRCLRDHREIFFPTHTHSFYEMLIILSGTVDYEVEGRQYQLRGGDIMLINPLQFHQGRISPERPYERYIVWMTPDLVRRLSLFAGKADLLKCFEQCTRQHHHLLRLDAESITAFSKSAKAMRQTLDEMKREPDDPYLQALISAQAFEFLTRLNRAYQNPRTLSSGLALYVDPQLGELITYINDHLGDDLSLDTLAARFHISKSHLSRQFKVLTRQTLHHFVLSKRLVQAKYLIETGMAPSRAALECGFNDYSNFSRAFRQTYGISPKQLTAGRPRPPKD